MAIFNKYRLLQMSPCNTLHFANHVYKVDSHCDKLAVIIGQTTLMTPAMADMLW